MRHFIVRLFRWVLVVLMPVVIASPAAQAQMLQVLHTFTGGADGGRPSASLIFDARGRLYGTTIYGGHTGGTCGTTGCGTVFKLTRVGSGWTLTPLYTFSGGDDGMNPTGNVIFGPNGLLYGTTYEGGGNGCGGNGCGTVFSLGPPARACTSALCPWRETILHRFSGNDGENPYAGVIFDAAGNLYGTTTIGGIHDDGVVFELTPSSGGWTETVLHSFSGTDGLQPLAGLIFDTTGNLYGTTTSGGTYSYGTVFELTPTQGGGWTEQVLYSFNYSGTSGADPDAGVILDAAGNLYGTTAAGGASGSYGTVYELMPGGGEKKRTN
jgi:uncharacterized repeat protein (TIGR03803 family)